MNPFAPEATGRRNVRLSDVLTLPQPDYLANLLPRLCLLARTSYLAQEMVLHGRRTRTSPKAHASR